MGSKTVNINYKNLNECRNIIAKSIERLDQLSNDLADVHTKIYNQYYDVGILEANTKLNSAESLIVEVIEKENLVYSLTNDIEQNFSNIENKANNKIAISEETYKGMLSKYGTEYGVPKPVDSNNSTVKGTFGAAIGGAINNINKKKNSGSSKSKVIPNNKVGLAPDFSDNLNKRLNKIVKEKINSKTNSKNSNSGTTSKSGGSNTPSYSSSNTATTTAGVTASAAAVTSLKVSNTYSQSKKTTKIKDQKIVRAEIQAVETKPAQRVATALNNDKKNNTSSIIEKISVDDLKDLQIENHPYPPTDSSVIKPDLFINDGSNFDELKPLSPPTNNTPTQQPVVNNPAPIEQPTPEPVVTPNNTQAPSHTPAVSTPKRTVAPATNNNPVNTAPEPVVTPNNNQSPVITPQQSPSIADNVNNGTSSDLFGTDVDDFSGFDDTISSVGSDRSTGGSGVIPIVAGLGAAGAVGIGAKVYKDRKENNDLDLNEDRISNENKFWSSDDSMVIHSEKDEYLDAGESSYSSSSTPSYAAVDNSVDDNINKDTWEVSNSSDNSDMVNLLGNE